MTDVLANRQVHLRPLRGYHGGSVDKAGRAKVPAKVLSHLRECGDLKKFWITTVYGNDMRIYPEAEWSQVEEHLLNPAPEQRQAFNDSRHNADYYGEDAELDSQNRLILPAKLRRKLEMEDASVLFRVMRGYIEVVLAEPTAAHIESLEARSAENRAVLEASGL